jgi:hypothetical protein
MVAALLLGVNLMAHKPRLEPGARGEIDLLSTEQLRALYIGARGASMVPLLGHRASLAEIAAEIRWRLRREDWRFWLLASLTFVAAVASCASAVLAWLALHR